MNVKPINTDPSGSLKWCEPQTALGGGGEATQSKQLLAAIIHFLGMA